MTVWRIRRKIIRTAIGLTLAHLKWAVLAILGLGHFLCFVYVKVKLPVSLLCVCALPEKAVSDVGWDVELYSLTDWGF